MIRKQGKPIKYIITENGCWNCTSHSIRKGYPRIGITIAKKKVIHISISRYHYTIYKGEIPEGMVVRHTCDNTLCINPDHLILGTWADNMQDKVDRGRQYKGEDQITSKLKEEQVKEILLDTTTRVVELAEKYGVGTALIYKIKGRTAWKHVKI